MHGVFVTAITLQAIEWIFVIVRQSSTITLNGFLPGKFNLSIFDIVQNNITIRDSIVGIWKDLQEAPEFSKKGKILTKIRVKPLININSILERIRAEKIIGQIVIDMTKKIMTFIYSYTTIKSIYISLVFSKN